MRKLSAHQQKIVDALRPQNKDVSIVAIYAHVYGCQPGLDVRKMQQKLAPTFAAINKKLHRGQIVPGELKQTYRYSHPHRP